MQKQHLQEAVEEGGREGASAREWPGDEGPQPACRSATVGLCECGYTGASHAAAAATPPNVGFHECQCPRSLGVLLPQTPP